MVGKQTLRYIVYEETTSIGIITSTSKAGDIIFDDVKKI